jgi:hypothetical protein
VNKNCTYEILRRIRAVKPPKSKRHWRSKYNELYWLDKKLTFATCGENYY